jgi:hypothetical protein
MNEKKIIEYKIAEMNNQKAFKEHMNFHIKKGYQPYGLPFVSPDKYIQAMVKYED